MTHPPRPVCIVEDDDAVREALVRLCRSAQLPVLSFSSADDLLAKGVPADTACLVTDVVMPGTGGSQLQETLHDQRPEIPLIFLTANDDPAVRDRARALGASAFFRKPVDDQALLDAIHWASTPGD